MLITANLSFPIDDQIYQYEGCEISEYGVSELPWNQLNPETHLGTKILISISLPAQINIALKVEGQILREANIDQDYMTIKFLWTPEKLREFKALLKSYGHPPEPNFRSLPRLLSSESLKYFPKNISLYKTPDTSSGQTFNTIGSPIITQVQDINPYGTLVSTENQLSASFSPYETVIAVIEPRGGYNHQIRIQSKIVRILDDFAADSGNPIRKLAVKFIKVHPMDLRHFKNFMTLIIEEIQHKSN